MRIKVHLFGSLSEIASSGSLDIMDVKSTDELVQEVYCKYPEMSKMNFALAVNAGIIRKNTLLYENDEVAFLPPYAGG